jgi:hypothetical protein
MPHSHRDPRPVFSLWDRGPWGGELHIHLVREPAGSGGEKLLAHLADSVLDGLAEEAE